ncbi:unnamed protein product [Linum tenue]|uniref:Secreted protein n=1 Tax=Linum tenue TaxID=586396 RepID=A0AAV0HVM4_9ROSI|nr:unnamed protein product [Linum tenue]
MQDRGTRRKWVQTFCTVSISATAVLLVSRWSSSPVHRRRTWPPAVGIMKKAIRSTSQWCGSANVDRRMMAGWLDLEYRSLAGDSS